ncbi:MAG: MFS transporter [Bacteroidales bacterium]|jgi:maltose/moltooligosaccharide transporter|nr:MFS transporter [Bacteroidales bacterium]MDD4383785.1 MFS transporter [Bacteroidales bacterium]MDY0198342.1 MFS transporter [Tenuifilaceae bacterium]
MTKRPRLSFWQIWNMSFGFLGIQFGFALQNANVSRIFETLGANIDDIPILWIAAPITGLIVQPIIGHMSDNTWGRFGRRRPFFLVGAILASLALIVMPNSPVLWVAAGMLWILDASINVSMEPFRAFVGDMLPSEQRTKGFAMQSFFIGTGAVVASALPYILTEWFNIANTAPEGQIPPSVKWSFYLGAIAFFTAVLWTIIKTKEYSPKELKTFEKAEQAEVKEKTGSESIITQKEFSGGFFFKQSVLWLIAGLVLTIGVWYFKLDAKLFIVTVGVLAFGFVQLVVGLLKNAKRNNGGLVVVMNDLFNMPKTMVQLAVVQFFSWFALFAMWIYTTAAVTKHIYGTTDATSELFNEGANWVGICFATYNGFAAIVAFLLPVIAKHTSRKITHAISLVAGGIGLISIYFVNTPNMLLVSMLGVGLAWASILSMPYAILTGSLPSNKMGTYMGIFNFFIVIPQILAASLLGFFTSSIFGGEAIYSLMLGGASMIIAAIMVFFVTDKDDVVALK